MTIHRIVVQPYVANLADEHKEEILSRIMKLMQDNPTSHFLFVEDAINLSTETTFEGTAIVENIESLEDAVERTLDLHKESDKTVFFLDSYFTTRVIPGLPISEQTIFVLSDNDTLIPTVSHAVLVGDITPPTNFERYRFNQFLSKKRYNASDDKALVSAFDKLNGAVSLLKNHQDTLIKLLAAPKDKQTDNWAEGLYKAYNALNRVFAFVIQQAYNYALQTNNNLDDTVRAMVSSQMSYMDNSEEAVTETKAHYEALGLKVESQLFKMGEEPVYKDGEIVDYKDVGFFTTYACETKVINGVNYTKGKSVPSVHYVEFTNDDVCYLSEFSPDIIKAHFSQ